MTTTKSAVTALAILFLTALPTGLPALECVDYSTNPRLISSLDLGLWTSIVASAGEFAYLGTRDCCPDASRLRVVDMSVPTSPVLRGSLDLPDRPIAIAATTSHVFLVLKDTGLFLIDVTDPDAPSVAGSYASPLARSLELSGSLVYLLNELEGIDVLDVSDPAAPVLAGSSDVRSPYEFVVTGPQRAIATDYRFLYVYDLTDPLAPALAGELEADPYCWPGDCSSFRSVAGAGDIAWVTRFNSWCTDYDCICQDFSSRLQAYDLSDPANPVAVTTRWLPASPYTGLLLHGDRLHVFCEGDRIFDVTDPGDPTLLHGLPSATAGVVVPSGSSELLLSAGASTLNVFDVTNADRPHGVPSQTGPGEIGIARRDASVFSCAMEWWHPCGIGSSEACWYVSEFEPEADPSQPIATWSQCGTGYGYFNGLVDDVEIAGGDLYLAVANDGLYRSDLGEPGTPVPDPTPVPFPVNPISLAASGDHLLVANGAAGFSVVDASVDPPTLVVPPTGPYTRYLATSGVLAAAVDWPGGTGTVTFRMIGIADPTAPVELGDTTWSADGARVPRWIALDGTVAATGIGTGLTRVLDVSDPSSPRVAAQITLPGSVGLSSFSGSIAASVLYIAAGDQGIAAFDVSDPDAPVYRGSISTVAAHRILATTDAVYATVGGGVIALPPDCGATTASELPYVDPSAVRLRLTLAAAPNPFADDVRLRWSAPIPATATLDVFDVAGRRVRSLGTTRSATGSGVAVWDGRDASGRIVTPGLYFVRMRAGGDAITRKLVRVQ